MEVHLNAESHRPSRSQAAALSILLVASLVFGNFLGLISTHAGAAAPTPPGRGTAASGGLPRAPTGSSIASSGSLPALGSLPRSLGAVPIGEKVQSTLDLRTGTLSQGAVGTLNAVGPIGIAYAPTSNQLFVAEANSNAISVLNASTWSIVAVLPAGVGPTGAVYDSGNGLVYVANTESGNLTVVNPLSDRVVDSFSVSVVPYAMAYDSANGYLYVGNGAGNNVLVINPATKTQVASITIGNYVSAVAYDSTNGEIYAVTDVSQVVGFIDGSTNTLLGNRSVGTNALSICFDAANGYIYVGNAGSNNITVLDGATNLPVAPISTSNPGPMFVDPTNHELYVAANTYVVAISTSTGSPIATIPTGSGAQAIALDGSSGNLFVTERQTQNISVVDPSTQTAVGSTLVGAGATDLVADPAAAAVVVLNPVNNELFVIDRDHRLAATIPLTTNPSALTLDSKNGLVYVFDYGFAEIQSFNISTRLLVNTFSVPTLTGGGAIAYDPDTNHLVVAANGADQVAFVNPETGSVDGSVTVGAQPSRLVVDPASDLVFVGNYGSDNVSVLDGATMRIVGTVPIGGGVTGMSFDPADGQVYVADNVDSNLTILDGASGLRVGNATALLYPGSMAFDPTFGGLWVLDRSSTTLTLVVGATMSSRIGVSLPATPVAASFDPTDATLEALSGSSGALYSLGPVWGFPVTFTAVGLPPSSGWSVNVTVAAASGTGRNLEVDLASGSYGFTVSAPPGFTASPSSGTLVVNGSSVAMSIVFTPIPAQRFAVHFLESGLPASTPWAVTVNTSISAATGAGLDVSLANGSYPYFVTAPAGYSATPADGVLAVNGTAQSVHLAFAALPKTNPNPSNNSSRNPSSGSGKNSTTTVLPATWLWLLAGLVIVETAAVAAMALALLRRPGTTQPLRSSPGASPPAGAQGPPQG
ncbi:MAG: YncE family protein [Thermoplasmata archaeon]|nr:YncE family protein [Thermoplasmata archaeon]